MNPDNAVLADARMPRRQTEAQPRADGTREVGCLDIDAGLFAANFDRRPFLIGHDLSGDRLFDLHRLVQLARRLPRDHVEYNAGNIPVSLAPGLTPHTGLSAEETIRRIDECQSWMVLKFVEREPEYRDLLHRCLAEVARHSERMRPGMMHAQGFIFISSPDSVTPYHMDPEHNFLLQVRGRKHVRLFDGTNRAIVSEEQRERLHCGAPRNLDFRDEFEAGGLSFDLDPGDGLHFPVGAPHYVKNGDEVSISFSITFRTPDLERRALTHRFNAIMRKRGLQPSPVGAHPSRDAFKRLAFRTIRRLQRSKPATS